MSEEDSIFNELLGGSSVEVPAVNTAVPMPTTPEKHEWLPPLPVKKPMGRPKANPKDDKRIDAIENKLNGLVDAMADFMDKFKTVATVVPAPQPVVDPAPAFTVTPPATILQDLSMPTPPSWIAKMNEILGEGFEMDVVEGSGGDAVMRVYLPEQWKRDKTIKGRDHSSGLIRRASSLNDVQAWCEKIKKNIQTYHPTFKTIINV